MVFYVFKTRDICGQIHSSENSSVWDLFTFGEIYIQILNYICTAHRILETLHIHISHIRIHDIYIYVLFAILLDTSVNVERIRYCNVCMHKFRSGCSFRL